MRTNDYCSLNVWGGILGDQVINSSFIDDVLIGVGYREFLKYDFAYAKIIWLQQDGAPVHYHQVVG